MVSAFLIAACAATGARAAVVLDREGQFGPGPQSETQRIAFQVPDGTSRAWLDTAVTLEEGQASVRIVSPKGNEVFDARTGGSMTLSGKLLKTGGETGTFHLVLVPEKAVGAWSATVRTGGPADLRDLYLLLISATGMMVVAFGAVAIWRLRSGAGWRWFWVGAAVWTVGVALKIAWAVPLNKPILGAMKAGLPDGWYLAAGSLYIGILTGVFEIGVTLVAALIWRRMTRDATRGVAVGVGAGAFEALLLGMGALGGAVAALVAAGPIREQVLSAVVGAAGTTPLFWLVGPVERVIAVACHVASRALVLVGVARGKWLWPFLAGFLLLSAVDAVAGYAHLSGVLGRVSTWWIELALAPAAVVSIPLLIWSLRKWPEAEDTLTTDDHQGRSHEDATARGDVETTGRADDPDRFRY